MIREKKELPDKGDKDKDKDVTKEDSAPAGNDYNNEDDEYSSESADLDYLEESFITKYFNKIPGGNDYATAIEDDYDEAQEFSVIFEENSHENGEKGFMQDLDEEVDSSVEHSQ